MAKSRHVSSIGAAMRFVVIALLGIHGLIHGLGVVKAFGLAELPQLTQPITRGWGVAWGACALLLIAAAAVRGTGASSWWLLAAPALVLSQVVIVASWHDAKLGTAVNVVLLVPVIIGFGVWRFEARTRAELGVLRARISETSRPVVGAADLAALPGPVAGWLERAGVVGRPRPRTVHLTQRGSLNKAPGEAWMSFRADQWFLVPEPGFVWVAHVDAGHGLSMDARDRYLAGTGSMRVELLSLIPVADSAGPKIDQGALVRFLAETMWFPAAALEPYLRWEPIDETSARAIIRHGDVEAAGVFRFDADANVIGFAAKRYREDALEDWIITNDPGSVRVVDHVRIPTRSTVTWRPDAGEPWTWLRLEIEDLERDRQVGR